MVGALWREQRWRIRVGALACIKTVTGNPELTLHHGRHSAGNLVGAVACRFELPDWWNAFLKNDACQQSTRRTLLGRTETSRRSGWAASSYLGHARPGTSIENYWHFLWDTIWQAIPIDNRLSGNMKWKHAIELEGHIEPVTPLAPVPTEIAYRPATPQRLLCLFRYLANGHTSERPATILRMDPRLGKSIHRSLPPANFPVSSGHSIRK